MGGFYFYPFCVSNVHIFARTRPPFIPLWNTNCRSCCNADPPPPHTHTHAHNPTPTQLDRLVSPGKERIAGSQNRERGRGRVVLSNLPQVNHMTQAIRIRKPWRLRPISHGFWVFSLDSLSGDGYWNEKNNASASSPLL